MRSLINYLRDCIKFVHELIFPLREDEVLIKNCTVGELRALVSPQKLSRDAVIIESILPYRVPTVQSCILEAKFHHNERAYELLASLLADRLAELLAEHPETPFILIPVPLGPKRRKERGYNQVEEVAKAVIRGLRSERLLLASHLLIRTRNTAPQMELGRVERLTNLQNAFVCPKSSISERFLYIVLDDVLTTGATLTIAATALRAAGASKILCLSLAH